MRKSDLEQRMELLKHRFAASPDLIDQKVNQDEKEIRLLYLDSLCDEIKIKKDIIDQLYDSKGMAEFEMYISMLPGSMTFQSFEKAVQFVLTGHVAILCFDILYFLDVKIDMAAQPQPTTIENTILGPKTALSEDVKISLAQVRKRYLSASLKIENQTAGTISKTAIYLVYDEELVDPEVLKQVKEKIAGINEEVVQSAGQLEQLINSKKKMLFPTMLMTERPDRVAFNLAEGKIAMLIDGTGFALVVPSVFYDFFSAVEDLYLPFWVSNFLVVIRYFGLAIALLVPAIYVSVASYNPEVFRVQLSLSIAGSRAAVPYPSFIEVLFMLGMMELLTEASLRLPKVIGSTATTVGGLILGQAAQQAGLVSSIMIIVVAAVAISNFVIPINTMGLSIRVAKYLLLLFSSIFGIIGVVGAFVALVIHLCSLRSFGKPYFKLFIGEPGDRPVRHKARTIS
ncbi:spore germination protein [Paenibacillus filicis]|uniref:Spore germination protein n=1 Tax=Paenibacillus gyeongsangnamensis TaxID=3388067 RepID=A0ABT4QK41_9BACL|nr:spore germination protein [Paenibacillus filicis]MCZ8517071.1 spore germination protein [Paenibacillus filicis]